MPDNRILEAIRERVPLTRYGIPQYVAAGALCAAVTAACALWVPAAIPVPVAAFLFVLAFFRDPHRVIPDGENLLLAPADGKVVEIAEVREDRYIGGEALRIGLSLSVLDVHVNRAPCSGRAEYLEYRRGQFLNALRPQAAERNESNALGIRSESLGGMKVLVRQISGAIARRIVCDCRVDDVLQRGQRFGMIKFGSRTEIYIPRDRPVKVLVSVGQKVKGGVTILAAVESSG